MHIILVEDDAQLGAAIQRALERLAYTVSVERAAPPSQSPHLWGRCPAGQRGAPLAPRLAFYRPPITPT